ncbi:MAG: hypothetical protein HUN04_13165 [Desulfobacter sp.]|nr:MAG: hypothetical protein HUN04_13165 [Desulfobacter sp.]
MMKKLPLVLMVLFLSSCVPMTPPKALPEKGKTLFVGRVIYEGSGVGGGAVSLNGKALKNLEVTIKNQSEKFTVKTGDEGLFYFYGTSKDYYRIIRFQIKRTIGGAWSSHSSRVYYTILGESDGVTNIGTFNWKVTSENSNILRSEKYSEVQSLFKKIFPENHWNDERWTQIYPF